MMKKFFSIASLALLAASMLMTGCKKENDGNVFRLKIQQYQGQGKTTLGDNGATLWVDGDQVYVNGATDEDKVTVNDSQAEVTSAPINGKYYFFYPGNCSVTGFEGNEKSFTYTMPSQFTFYANALKAPMAGVSNGQEVTFANLCTMLKLEFFIIPKQVVITSTDNTPLSGTFTASYNNGEWSVSAGSTSTTLTINNDNQSPFIYVPLPAGDHKLTITAYKNANSVVTSNVLATKTMGSTKTMEMNYLYDIPMNAHPFTVSNTGKKVYFSPGNLLYNGTIWKFADQQNTIKNSYTVNNSIITSETDVFCWATSGYGGTVPNIVNYTSPLTSSMTGDNANYDWGVYNAISNGGNTPGIWRTLTSEEWSYLVTGNDRRYKRVYVRTGSGANATRGLIILPDDCGELLNNGYPNVVWQVNVDKISELESMGAVFLPANGYVSNTGVHNSGDQGYYWSTDPNTNTTAKCLLINTRNSSASLSIQQTQSRTYPCHVRLVRNAN